MSKYIKSFKTTAEYNAYIAGDHATPYTAYVEEEDKYYYGAKEPEMMEFEFPASPSGAFNLVKSIKSVSIPSGATTTDRSSFQDGFNLTSVTIPDGFTTIEFQCFSNCSSLTSVTIPSTVTIIGNNAFGGCTSLASVTILATTPPLLGNANVFINNASGRKIYVPAESVEAYKVANNWSTYASAIEAIQSA